MTETLNIVILAAVSTNEQAEGDKFSLDAQIADSMAVAEKNGWNVIDVIRIEGHSRNYRTLAQLAAAARSNNEPGFDRLIAHFEKRDFQVLIVRDANRFARKPSLLYEIVDTILEDCNARIYSLSDGMVDSSNADMWLMIKGYEIRKQMKWLQQELVRGRRNLVDEKGFPEGSGVVWSHHKIRDERLKVIAFVPDPDKSIIIQDAAQLVIDRLGWRDIESTLFSRFGHGRNGKPFRRYFFYNLFYNPWFWGDASRNYNNPKFPRGFRLWRIDPNTAPPEGVIIRRNVNPPAITGELATQLKAELIRRLDFKPRQHSSVHRFSGLLVCGHCGSRLTFTGGTHHAGYYCQSKYNGRTTSRCDIYRYTSESAIQEWLAAALVLAVEQANPFYFVDPPDGENPSAVTRIEQLKKQKTAVENQARRLIDKQALAPESLASIYDEQIDGLGEQLTAIQASIEDEEHKAFKYNVGDVQSAYEALTAYQSVQVFFEADDGIINQLLHRLLGKRRLVIRDKQVVGTVEL